MARQADLERRVLVAVTALLAPILVGAATADTGTVGGSGSVATTGVGGSPPIPGATGDTAHTGASETGDTALGKIYGCGCAHGRPLSGAALPVGVAKRSDWIDRRVVPDVRGVDPDGRAHLAAFWSSVGRNEHGSIGSFHRAALELLRAGGPDRLVAASERGAADERRHARQAFAIASAFAGRDLGPAAATDPVPVAATLAEVAARTVVEGCGEEARSLAAAVAMREGATDPAVRAVLDGLVRDEARHVRLAFRVVRWAAKAGGPEVAAAIRHAGLRPLSPLRGAHRAPPALAAWGLLGDDVLATVANHVDGAVLAPARARLAA